MRFVLEGPGFRAIGFQGLGLQCVRAYGLS